MAEGLFFGSAGPTVTLQPEESRRAWLRVGHAMLLVVLP